jgi:hypothetical protein
MEMERVDELLKRYNEGRADAADMKLIESMIEAGTLELSQLDEAHQLQERLMQLEYPGPSRELDDRFYAMLARQKAAAKSFSWSHFFSWPQLAPKLAFASVTLIVGLIAGYLLKPSNGSQQVELLSRQVSALQEMMMLSLLEKESATERLRAVSLTQEMDEVSHKVTQALIQTLNQDENVNVRLAALEALKPYVGNSNVRKELVKSIAMQNSPLVQVGLAELMAAIQEKSSVIELEKILENDSTPNDVKNKIKESINVMI